MCSTTPSCVDACNNGCGNGTVEAVELCDYGNAESRDGCDGSCRIRQPGQHQQQDGANTQGGGSLVGAEEVFWGSKVCMVACDASGPDDPISHHRLVVTEVVELWACCQGEKDCWSSTMSKTGPG